MLNRMVPRHRTGRILVAAATATALVLLLHGTGFGQDTPAVPSAPSSLAQARASAVAGGASSVSFGELFAKGGPLMWPLAAMSIMAVAFTIYGFFVLREDQVTPRNLRRELLARLRTGSLREARAACGEVPCPMSEIALTAMDYLETEDVNAQLLKDLIEGEGTRQAVSIQQQTQWLLDIAVIAPMVGLLGTVFGMIRAFNVVALDLAKAKPTLLAAGVSEALITTAAGLIIGIPAMAFHAYLRARANKLISRLESVSTEILTLLLRKVQP
jgi:biopolymer transport protein ExbB